MNLHCPHCKTTKYADRNSTQIRIKKDGSYYRSSDRKTVQRYFCLICSRYFSRATLGECYRQKKRHINSKVARQLVSGVSMRETARVLKINRKTVHRKLLFMGRRAQTELELQNRRLGPVAYMQFDDMETFEHTKCKPISIGLAVEEGTRRILGFEIARMPAKGLLAEISVKKYGKRKDERPEARKRLFERLRPLVKPGSLIKTDESTFYPHDIKRIFYDCEHQTFKGRKSAVVGQGELKKIGFDPLFSLNHTAAMARYKISRLIRRTWNTTKKPEYLALHFALMAVHHNQSLDLLPPIAAG